MGSILTSRHPQVVKAFLSEENIKKIVENSNGNNSISNLEIQKSTVANGITIEDIEGNGFKGKVMLIKDPQWVKVAITKQIGITGQRVSDFVKDTGAVAGINAGGFYDPDGAGNGGYPDGITVHQGKIVHNNIGDNKSTDMIAFDQDGKMILGQMTASDIEKNKIQEAVSFWPALIKDGKKGTFNDGEWGIAPRTAIGQKADGTVIFVVIDSRQPLWSLGAKMSDLYNIFLKYNAVNAANLDGGSSTEMFYNGKVINKLWNAFGERYLPTAFVVVPK